MVGADMIAKVEDVVVTEEARMKAIVGGLMCVSISRDRDTVGLEIPVDLATAVEETKVEETKVFDAVATSSIVVVAEKTNDPVAVGPWKRDRQILMGTRKNRSS